MASKILIRLPDDLLGRLLSFPFLFKLQKELKMNFEQNEIFLHIITARPGHEVLFLLPFNAFYHPLEHDDLANMFTMHRACHYFNFGKLDTYFNLTQELKDASVGLSLKIKDRVGFETSKTKWILNKCFPFQNGLNQSDNYINLLSLIPDYWKEGNIVPRLYSRELSFDLNLEKFRSDIIIDLPVKMTKEGEMINPVWIEFFEGLTNQKILLVCSSINASSMELQIEDFKEKLPNKNIYMSYYLGDTLEFSKIISKCNFFISFNPATIHLSTFLGKKSFGIFPNIKQIQNISPAYNLGILQNFYLDDFNLNYESTSQDYYKLFDLICDEIIEKKQAPNLELVQDNLCVETEADQEELKETGSK